MLFPPGQPPDLRLHQHAPRVRYAHHLARAAMLIVLGLALCGQMTPKNQESVQLISWFWHFVDAVWIVVFSIVYLLPHAMPLPA